MTNTAASMTYDSLVSDVQSYCERPDDTFAAQIPRFIMLAENRIASEVKGLGQIKVVAATLELGNPVIPKPTRWRETASFNITNVGQRKSLYERTYEYCRYFAPDDTVRDVPRFYSDYGYEYFFIAPSPVAAYPFEVLFFERPVPLSSSNQTNWNTQYAPQLILYATLLEAQIWLKLDDRMATFQSSYDRASAAVTAEAKRRMFDRSAIVKEG